MTLAVALFGLFVAALGVAGVASPGRLLSLVTRTQARAGPWLLAALRFLIGIALILAAPPSRAPLYLKLLGVLSTLSAALTPLVGDSGFQAILGWWRRRSPAAVRVWSAFVCIFGASLVWAVFPATGSA